MCVCVFFLLVRPPPVLCVDLSLYLSSRSFQAIVELCYTDTDRFRPTSAYLTRGYYFERRLHCIHMEIKGANEERQLPLLLISQKEKQFFYNILDNRFHTINIPELRNKYILTSAFGWLILVDINTEDCYLWNPVSLDKIELPELTCPLTYNKCHLSKPPTEPDCHILFIAGNGLSRHFCQIGDDQFVTQTTTDNVGCLSAVASFQGKIYGIVISHFVYQFVTANFVGGTLELNPILIEGGLPWGMPQPSRPWTQMHVDYLIESSCGELLLVHKMFRCIHLEVGLEFRVFRVDVDQMECKELENIGEQAIFISDDGEAFCCSSLGVKPNSIYFTVPESRNLYIYDLNDRSTSASLPCSIARRSMIESYWVPPQIFRNFLN
ncbi:hypothetical protein BUALT_Bualt14G0128100 [Buddleja alternifolia]|uniref:KIB1-4 beta-propeller domain-containing protein n=1 Tax=Buddleja alternifolia TaxID=168488 RepID=A0AAV6WKB5_9LAMI|nr:hypothetical protein BUALT_Bualt14G0127500 [Buddleja alternifolia]KAG8370544.1 hypothetical protein BUALT_Bualt14G0128100 [Buddleja alternifolia]